MRASCTEIIRRGVFKMSDNTNFSSFEFDNNNINESEINENNPRRFALTTEEDVNELVSNAQAQSTKYKTIYAVNTFKGKFVYTIDCIITTFPIHKRNNKIYTNKYINITTYVFKNGPKSVKLQQSCTKWIMRHWTAIYDCFTPK